MAKAIKGCTNINCQSFTKKIEYKDNNDFCPKCGQPLHYVCKDCWMELPDGTQKYCVRCAGIRKDKRDEWVKSTGEAILKGAKATADFVADTGKVVGKKTKEIAIDVKDETDKVIEKIKESNKDIKLPKAYKKTKDTFPQFGFEAKNRNAYKNVGKGYDALILKCLVDEKASMDLDNVQLTIDALHSAKLPDAGIIEVIVGKTNCNSKYCYQITKHRLKNKDGAQVGNEYRLGMNIKVDDIVYYILGSFVERGTTGLRDTMVMELIRRESDQPFDEFWAEWSKDPYDEKHKEGFLMNMSKSQKYDELFKEHPLSQVRELVKYIIENN